MGRFEGILSGRILDSDALLVCINSGEDLVVTQASRDAQRADTSYVDIPYKTPDSRSSQL
jgi:hypothetical protein